MTQTKVTEAIQDKYEAEQVDDFHHIIVNQAPSGFRKLHEGTIDDVEIEVVVGGLDCGIIRIGGQEGDLLRAQTGTVNRLVRTELSA